jgi:hypothetical protein
MGWLGLDNGKLLVTASREFEVFVTVDRNLTFQSRVISYDIAVVVLRARTNRLADLRPLVPELLAAIPAAKRGAATFVGG